LALAKMAVEPALENQLGIVIVWKLEESCDRGRGGCFLAM
jgi:hypothetical protein